MTTTAEATAATATTTNQNSNLNSNADCSSNSSTHHHMRFRWLYITLIVLVGAACSGAFLVMGIVGAFEEQDLEFNRDAQDMSHAIESALEDYEMFSLWIHESCHKVIGDPSTPPEVDVAKHVGFCSRDEFERLFEYVKASPVGLNFVAMHYIPNITHAMRKPLEEQSRQYYSDRIGPDFDYAGIKDTQIMPDGSLAPLSAAAERDWYFPIHYLLPLENNEQAVDIDVYPINKECIDNSIATGRPYMGQRFRLFNDPDDRSVFGSIFISPGIVTRQEEERESNPERRKTALSMIVIRIPDLIERASRFTSTSFTVHLFDNSTEHRDKDGNPLFLGAATTSNNDANNQQNHRRTFVLKDEVPYLQVPTQPGGRKFSTQIDVADHKWIVVIQPLDGMYQSDLTCESHQSLNLSEVAVVDVMMSHSFTSYNIIVAYLK